MKPSVTCGCQRVSRQSACAVEHPPSQSRFALFRQALMTLISAFLLILMPKCPLCLAAWITCLTGVGLSLTVASWLRLFLIGGSSGVLILVILINGQSSGLTKIARSGYASIILKLLLT